MSPCLLYQYLFILSVDSASLLPVHSEFLEALNDAFHLVQLFVELTHPNGKACQRDVLLRPLGLGVALHLLCDIEDL